MSPVHRVLAGVDHVSQVSQEAAFQIPGNIYIAQRSVILFSVKQLNGFQTLASKFLKKLIF